jgi:hypothetical protein
VWADGEANQNSTNRADLRQLQPAPGWEAIGLFAADGSLIDAVTFGQQTNDVSQGRVPGGRRVDLFHDHAQPGSGNINPNPSTPQITGNTVIGTQVTLTLSTIPARMYRVEYKNDLNLPAWTQLGADRLASGTSLTVLDNIGPNTQRFYRAILLP